MSDPLPQVTWIQCSDRMPTVEGVYLIVTGGWKNRVSIDKWFPTGGEDGTGDWAMYHRADVGAWSPMPVYAAPTTEGST